MRRSSVNAAAALGACVALIASGCGGGARQDAGEHARTYQLGLSGVSFQRHQSISKPTALRISVHNSDTRTVPNVAVTIDSFDYTERYPELAADKRPIWVIEQGPGAVAEPPVQSEAVSPPGGGQTAYVNTWALGPLASGATRTFEWKVVPVKAGTHEVRYEIAAGLAGRAKAAPPSGARALDGVLTADIAPAPPSRHVDPSTGKVVAGQFPSQP
ncbi:MAG TPA: hypothetical protein VGX69_05575 [Solirubrobacteraceae bacterium]|nr:hypothetical protein [Solirubrobacteraceae bacterium]